MRFEMSAIMFVLLLFTVSMLGLVQGAEVAYGAESAGEATVSFNGTHYQLGTTAERVQTDINASDDPDPVRQAVANTPAAGVYDVFDYDTPLDPYIVAGVEQFTETMLVVCFHLAALTGSVSAAIFYRLQFLPLWLVSGTLQVLGFLPYLAVGGVFLSRLVNVLGAWR